MNLLPALSHLLDKFEYNEETGHVILRCTGERTGWLKVKSGLRYLYADGGTYAEHRIIWFMKTGVDPKTGTVVHRNGDRADNRWVNLDLVPNPKETYQRQTPYVQCSPRPTKLPCVTTSETNKGFTFGTLEVTRTASGTLIFTPRTLGWIRKCALQQQKLSA